MTENLLFSKFSGIHGFKDNFNMLRHYFWWRHISISSAFHDNAWRERKIKWRFDLSMRESAYSTLKSANDMKLFIVLSESPLKVIKMAFYCFLTPFPVPKLWRFKYLKNDRKMARGTAQSWIRSIKINKICDIMCWTFDSRQSRILTCKYAMTRQIFV